MIWAFAVVVFLIWLSVRLLALGFYLGFHIMDLLLVIVFAGLVYEWAVSRNRRIR